MLRMFLHLTQDPLGFIDLGICFLLQMGNFFFFSFVSGFLSALHFDSLLSNFTEPAFNLNDPLCCLIKCAIEAMYGFFFFAYVIQQQKKKQKNNVVSSIYLFVPVLLF